MGVRPPGMAEGRAGSRPLAAGDLGSGQGERPDPAPARRRREPDGPGPRAAARRIPGRRGAGPPAHPGARGDASATPGDREGASRKRPGGLRRRERRLGPAVRGPAGWLPAGVATLVVARRAVPGVRRLRRNGARSPDPDGPGQGGPDDGHRRRDLPELVGRRREDRLRRQRPARVRDRLGRSRPERRADRGDPPGWDRRGPGRGAGPLGPLAAMGADRRSPRVRRPDRRELGCLRPVGGRVEGRPPDGRPRARHRPILGGRRPFPGLPVGSRQSLGFVPGRCRRQGDGDPTDRPSSSRGRRGPQPRRRNGPLPRSPRASGGGPPGARPGGRHGASRARPAPGGSRPGLVARREVPGLRRQAPGLSGAVGRRGYPSRRARGSSGNRSRAGRASASRPWAPAGGDAWGTSAAPGPAP